MTREQWEAAWRATFERLRDGGLGPIEAQRLAREMTTKRHGPQPAGPPLWLRLGLKFLAKKLSGTKPEEVNVEFSWLKGFAKSGQAVVETALALGGVVALEALLGALDTAEELQALGMPAVYAVVAVALVRLAANYVKVKKASIAAKALPGK